MSKSKRVWTVIGSVLAIQGAIFMMFIPELAFHLIALGLGLDLTFFGLKYIFYYLTHAQHMVGGKRIMLIGLLLFDAGVFSTLMVDQAQAILVIYVVAAHLVYAILNIIRTIGNKKDCNPGWKIDLAQFIGNIAQVVLCLVFIKHVEIPVFIYAIGVIYTAILKIVSAFKRTAIVYVQ